MSTLNISKLTWLGITFKMIYLHLFHFSGPCDCGFTEPINSTSILIAEESDRDQIMNLIIGKS